MEPYQQQLTGRFRSGDTLLLRDEKFQNPSIDWSLIQNRKVSNVIVFALNQDSLYLAGKSFTCKIDLKIEYWSQPGQADPFVEDNVSLEVNYDTTRGAVFKSEENYRFLNGHRVKITVKQISSAELGDELPGLFRLTSQVFVDRSYLPDPAAPPGEIFIAETGIQAPEAPSGMMSAFNMPITQTPNRVTLQWNKIGSSTEYDLEWSFVDEESPEGAALANTANHVEAYLSKLFRHNATRVTLEGQSYNINLVHFTKYMVVRLRGVTVDQNTLIRTELPWVYNITFTQAGGAVITTPGVVTLTNTWHNSNMSWQYNATYAENGKRKEVVSYFDKSLKNRQTVTLANNSNLVADEAQLTAVAQTTIYDSYGRPTINVLPAPLDSPKILTYTSGLNILEGTNTQYSFNQVTPPANECNFTFPAMSTGAGAGKYYSPASKFINDRFHGFVPNANGYPFSGQFYTNDNTGRISVQGGVGKVFQPNPDVSNTASRATRYFYGKPTQREIMRLFGNDVGDASHYMKNTVIDPNGQLSVAYLNMSGKTIATALASSTPSNLDDVGNKPAAALKTFNLFTAPNFMFDPVSLKLVAYQTYIAQDTGTVTFKTDVERLYAIASDGGVTACAECAFDIVVTINGDCLPQAFSPTVPAINGSAPSTGCTTLTPANSQYQFPFNIPKKGAYYIRMELRLRENTIKQAADQYVAVNNKLLKQFSFVMDELKATDFGGCFDDCKTCYAALGDRDTFMLRICQRLIALGVNVNDSLTVINNWAGAKWDALSAACTAARANCGDNPCYDLEKQLLRDVSPGGQYARFDTSGAAIDTATNMIYRHWRKFWPIKMAGADGYDDNIVKIEDGRVLSMNDTAFTVTHLASIWKAEWAKKFLPYHPEYCGLEQCRKDSASLKWDDKVKGMVLQVSDIAPILGGTQTFNKSNVGWLAAIDPYFTSGRGAAKLAAFTADLTNYSKNVKGLVGFTTKNLYAFNDYMLYCVEKGAKSNTSDESWDVCAPDAGCRALDREWQMYLQAYMELKQKYYQQMRLETDCAGKCLPGTTVTMNVNCARPGEFTFIDGGVSGNNRTVVVRYEAGKMGRTTTVDLYYPAEFGILNPPSSVTFAIGESQKAITVHKDIPVGLIKVSEVTCSGGNPEPPCNGTARILEFGTGGRKVSDKVWEAVVGTSVRTYYIKEGYLNAPPPAAQYCSGATFEYYNCLTIKNGTGRGERYTNVWLVTCPPVACTASGSFAATIRTNNTEYENSVQTIKIFPYTAQNNALTWNGCQYPVKNWYSCFTVTVGGITYNYRNATVFTCPVNCTATINYTMFVDSTRFTREVPSPRYYHNYSVIRSATQPSANCGPYGGTVAWYDCVKFTGGDAGTFYFYDVWVRTCNVLPPEEPENLVGGNFATESLMAGAADTCAAYKSMQPRIPSIDYGTLIDTLGLQVQGAAALQSQLANACASQADLWMSKLDSCLLTLTATQQTNLRNKLIELCNKGVDIHHPYGASTTPPGTRLPSGDSTFAQVIRSITGGITMKCNPWLLDGPYPYQSPAQLNKLTISATDSLICNRIDSLKARHLREQPGVTFIQYLTNKFGASNTLSAAEVTSLLSGCSTCKFVLNKDIELPVFISRADTPCITGSQMYRAWNEMVAAHTVAMDAFHVNYETIVMNYFNQKWGYTLGFADYKALYDAYVANNNTQQVLCNNPLFTPTAVDPYSCLLAQVSHAARNGIQSYDRYITEVKRRFRQQYIANCSAAKAGLIMTQTEWEYHYTLYYYDQSGQLVKTIPPEGVVPLTDQEASAAEEAEKGPESCTYSGPAAATNISLTNAYVETAMQAGAHALEMWLYRASLPHGQLLLTTSINGYLVSACIGTDNMDLDLYKLKAVDASNTAVEIEYSRHFKVSLNANNLRPFMHLVLQGTAIGSLTGTPVIYINGELCSAVTSGTTPGSCGWEIGYVNGVLTLPQNTSLVKHLRGYNRVLTPAEIKTLYGDPCMNVGTGLAAVREHWGRFNVPAAGTATTVGNSTVETRYAKVYPHHTMNSTYSFHSLNGVTNQQSPDGGATQFWYDWLGRLVASRNAIQPAKTSYTKYDGQSRIVEVGEREGGGWATTFLRKDTTDAYLGRELATRRSYTVTQYDVADAAAAGKDFNNSFAQRNLRKRVSASYLYASPSNLTSAAYYSYDMMGNVNSLLHQLAANTYKRIDYDFDLASGKVNKVRYQLGAPDQFLYVYDYDAENRLVEAKSAIKTTSADKWDPENAIVNAHYYYYKHGPLARMELGGKVQGVDYAYTLQGWLKAVNGDRLDPASDMGGDSQTGNNITFNKDVLAYTLNYYKYGQGSAAVDDYSPIKPGAVIGYDWKPASGRGASLFNGNISRTTVAMDMASFGGSSNPVGYAYRYDQLNRLKEMTQHPSLLGGDTASVLAYKEFVTYDGNGNILGYHRNGDKTAAGQEAMDRLAYAYNFAPDVDGVSRLANNRLRHVTDGVAAGTYDGDLDPGQAVDNYGYDAIGNLVRDTKEGISLIKWTVYGKISEIIKTNGDTIRYLYDPTGNRIRKEVYTAGAWTKTWYARDAQGNLLGSYVGEPAALQWKEQHLYGSSRLGYWEPNPANPATTWGANNGATLYELSNHLGNVMAVISDSYNASTKVATVKSIQDYYPFGMVMPGRSFKLGGVLIGMGLTGRRMIMR
ncbi:hypothetical protein [Chitinophaga caseinilytica]|uniref:RHS repeat-associated core domain-containing protein n=1 Tax=Chitinophaga caseinilytica TaxID=2267521 RepID=A0ABZ2YYS8_9BACT